MRKGVDMVLSFLSGAQDGPGNEESFRLHSTMNELSGSLIILPLVPRTFHLDTLPSQLPITPDASTPNYHSLVLLIDLPSKMLYYYSTGMTPVPCGAWAASIEVSIAAPSFVLTYYSSAARESRSVRCLQSLITNYLDESQLIKMHRRTSAPTHLLKHRETLALAVA